MELTELPTDFNDSNIGFMVIGELEVTILDSDGIMIVIS